jgi:diacylglycerol kinase (ATP)
VRGTTRAGDEARLVAEALSDGVETIVVAGGDGTWSKCAVALARAGSPARMAFLSAGTGNDFAKNLDAVVRDPDRLAAALAAGVHERRVDLGRVDDTWFLNVAGFGLDVAALVRANASTRFRGQAVYLVAALQEMVLYRGRDAEVDGHAARRLMMVFSNGEHFGGAFHIAPDARIDDGLLDAILVDDVSVVARIPMLVRVMRGTHRTHSRVTHRRLARFALRFAEPPWFEADGELHRAAGTSVEVASVPGVLRVVDA